jgi:hypothetical protein
VDPIDCPFDGYHYVVGLHSNGIAQKIQPIFTDFEVVQHVPIFQVVTVQFAELMKLGF